MRPANDVGADDVGRLLAVIQWCTEHGLEPRDVIEGRHLDAFDEPTFPSSPPRKRCPGNDAPSIRHGSPRGFGGRP